MHMCIVAQYVTADLHCSMHDTRGVMVAPDWLVSHRVRRFESGVLVVQSLSHDETAIIRDTEAVVCDDRKSRNTQCHTHVHACV